MPTSPPARENPDFPGAWPVTPLVTRGPNQNVTVPAEVVKDALLWWLQSDDMAVIERGVAVLSEVHTRLPPSLHWSISGLIANVISEAYDREDPQHKAWCKVLGRMQDYSMKKAR